MKTWKLGLLAITSILLVVGCTTPFNKNEKKLYDTKTVTGPPTTAVQVSTNTTVDVLTGITTVTYSTNTVTVPGTTITILVPRQDVQSGLDWFSKLPIPYAGPIAGALGYVYAGWASLRNRKVNGSLVDGIETLGDHFYASNPTGYDTAMKQVVDQQIATGTRESILPLVQART